MSFWYFFFLRSLIKRQMERHRFIQNGHGIYSPPHDPLPMIPETWLLSKPPMTTSDPRACGLVSMSHEAWADQLTPNPCTSSQTLFPHDLAPRGPSRCLPLFRAPNHRHRPRFHHSRWSPNRSSTPLLLPPLAEFWPSPFGNFTFYTTLFLIRVQIRVLCRPRVCIFFPIIN